MKTWLPVTMILFGLSNAADFAFGQTWVQSDAPDNSWVSVASSADGTKLVAAATMQISGGTQYGTGQIYTSTNSGLNWTIQTNAPATEWARVASSADGNKLVAVEAIRLENSIAASNSPPTGIYTSTDSGVTWTLQTNAPNVMYWTSVVSSPDGNRLAATAISGAGATVFGMIYLSTDAGTNWTATDLPTNYLWEAIATSADSSKLIVAGDPGPIYVSTNFGTTWTQAGVPSANWFSVAASVDGTKFVAATFHDGLYISTNSGTDWSHLATAPYTPLSNWFSVAFSANNKLVAAGLGAPVYLSADCGETWFTNSTPSYSWLAVAASADGNKLAAVSHNNGIWISQATPSPKLKLTNLGHKIALSWTVPSTNFVLQQSSDLTAVNWVTLTNTPALNFTNLNDEVRLSATNASGFFRLVTQ